MISFTDRKMEDITRWGLSVCGAQIQTVDHIIHNCPVLSFPERKHCEIAVLYNRRNILAEDTKPVVS